MKIKQVATTALFDGLVVTLRVLSVVTMIKIATFYYRSSTELQFAIIGIIDG